MKNNKLSITFVSLLFMLGCTESKLVPTLPLVTNNNQIELIAVPNILSELNKNQNQPFSPRITIHDTLMYSLTETLEVVNQGPGQTEKHNLWIALIQSIPPYQKVTSFSASNPNFHLVEDEYGNRYAEYTFGDLPIDQPQKIIFHYEIEINRLQYDFGDCDGDMIGDYTQAEFLIESSNPEIISIAKSHNSTDTTPCELVRTHYEYVTDNLDYTMNNHDWGAMAALGPAASDCTEYSSLLIALCRASEIPANYLEGIIYIPDSSSTARTEHAWVEVYLPDIGWIAIDPTLGRFPELRERYFQGFPADHIIVTKGRHPSTLRGKSYFSHLYWGSNQTTIKIQNLSWSFIND